MRRSLRQRIGAMLLTALIAWAILLGMCLISGVEIGAYPYPSYRLQAEAWLRGQTHLHRNYQSLELAIHDGRYYVSFPPVPSVPMLLWVLIFGEDVPGGLFQKLYLVIACMVVVSELMRSRRTSSARCVCPGLLLCLGCAMLPISLVGAVWYEAQILAFLFSVSAIAALRRGRPTLTCLMYALAVGCRPFSALLGPVLLMMYLRQGHRRTLRDKFMRLLPGLALGLAVAAAYGAYNYVRFGNPFEFGHNYLPEFLRAEHGQLSFHYLWDNLKAFLFGSPFSLTENGISLNRFGFSLFISCPIFICNLVWIIDDLIRRRFTPAKGMIVLMGAANLVLLCMHRTLGGYQFGARYALELLPLTLCYLLLSPNRRRMSRWEGVLLGFGLIINFAGGCLVHV